MRFKTLAWLGLGLSFVACTRSNKDPDKPDAGVTDDAAPMIDAAVDLRIKDVQSDMMPPGTAVKLKGVIVTAIDSFGARTGD